MDFVKRFPAKLLFESVDPPHGHPGLIAYLDREVAIEACQWGEFSLVWIEIL